MLLNKLKITFIIIRLDTFDFQRSDTFVSYCGWRVRELENTKLLENYLINLHDFTKFL